MLANSPHNLRNVSAGGGNIAGQTELPFGVTAAGVETVPNAVARTIHGRVGFALAVDKRLFDFAECTRRRFWDGKRQCRFCRRR